MPGRLSGVEAIGPAFETTKRQLFLPFRFSHWSRLAIVVMSTGELTGGGGGGWSGLTSLPGAASGSGGKHMFPTDAVPGLTMPSGNELIPYIAAGIAFVVLFGLAFLYVASVFRFILFDSVLYDRCELAAGWRRWQKQGMSYFLWTLGFSFVSLGVIAVLIGGPIAIAWASGIFAEPDQHVVLLIVGGLALLFLTIFLILAGAMVALFAKDFVVPVMALEDLGILDGWRRVLPMLGAEKGAYTIYVLMKIGLAMGTAVLFGIADTLVLLLLLLPLGLVTVIVIVVAAAMGLTWNTLTICTAVLVGGAILMFLVYVICLVSTPAMVFFQAYTLHFFGSRYPRLGEQLALTTPPVQPSPFMPGAAAPA